MIRVSGELDLATAPLLRAAVDHVRRTHVPVRVAVDLSRVTFADSHGLAPVVDDDHQVVAASPTVRRVLHLLGPRLPVVGSAVARSLTDAGTSVLSSGLQPNADRSIPVRIAQGVAGAAVAPTDRITSRRPDPAGWHVLHRRGRPGTGRA